MISPRMKMSCSIALASLIVLGAGACGGDDDSTDAAVAEAEAASNAAADAADQALADAAAQVDASGGVANSVADAMGDEAGADLDAAIESMGTDSVMGIVADQLGEGTTVTVEGDSITFTVPSGSNGGTDPITQCIIAGSFKQEGQTITMVYPDGETVCA